MFLANSDNLQQVFNFSYENIIRDTIELEHCLSQATLDEYRWFGKGEYLSITQEVSEKSFEPKVLGSFKISLLLLKNERENFAIGIKNLPTQALI